MFKDFLSSFYGAPLPKKLAIASLLSMGIVASAQTYPTFTEVTETSATLATQASPALAPSPTLFVTGGQTVGMAYVDSSSGCVEISYSNNGYNFIQTYGTPICPGKDVTVAATYIPQSGDTVVAYVANGVLYTSTSTDGINFGNAQIGPEIAAQLTVAPTGRPSMVPYGSSVLLTYASGTGIYVTIGSVPANSYYDSFSPSVQIGSSYPASSNPTLTPFGTGSALVWCTGTGFPVVAILPGTNPTSPTSVTETTADEVGGDPAPVAYKGNLFIFGRSYYSADNLWAIGTPNGIQFPEPAQKYGATLTHSPSFVTWGSGSYLTGAGRSNYGSNIWDYFASY
jgi:hypothetical protein